MLPRCLIKNLDMKPGKIDIDFRAFHVMAILNVTPDSFYGASRTFSSEEIKKRAAQAIADGATIIDIGGYSSRPSAEDISPEEEWSRVERAIAAVRAVDAEVIISLDTFRSEVAERALEQFGAMIINDISAGELDPQMIDIVAKHHVPYIAMHMRGTPQTMQEQTVYNDVTEDVASYFKGKIEQLHSRGVESVIIDPGFGFAKNIDQNFELMAKLAVLTGFGLPMLVGVSRKSMIYKTLEVTPEESLTGTIALNWEALRQGATILRVHDVREAAEAIKLYKKIIGYDKC